MNEKKEWNIPVTWEEYGIVKIEAATLEEAMEIFKRDSDHIPLPEGNYIDGTFDLSDSDIEFIRCFN